MSKPLPATLLAQNPWAKVAQQWVKRPEGPYVLPEDTSVLGMLPAERLHLNLPPQPFIGNPAAPIWILGISPSIDPLDVYDQCDAKREGLPHTFRFSGKEEKAQLKRRRELLFQQLTLEGNLPFYVLDEAFHTVEKTGRGKVSGTYAWWSRYLLGKPNDPKRFFADVEAVSANCFALEAFPYHYTGTPNKKVVVQTQHFDFVTKLIAYAQTSGKCIVARKTTIDWLEGKAGLSLPQALRFSGSSMDFTKGNIINRDGRPAANLIVKALSN